jgi:hypothetical protein
MSGKGGSVQYFRKRNVIQTNPSDGKQEKRAKSRKEGKES